MRLTHVCAVLLVLFSFTIYGCTSCCSCVEETTSDVVGDKETPPEKNTVDSCEEDQTIECAGGGKRECDCSGDYCLWSACKT